MNPLHLTSDVRDVADEVRRLAQHLRRWSEQSEMMSAHSADEAVRLADALDQWARQTHPAPNSPTSESLDETLCEGTLPLNPRRRPRSGALPSVSALLGRSADSTPSPPRLASSPVVRKPKTAVRRPIAPKTLPLPQATPAAEPAPRVLPTPEPKTIDSPEPVNPTRTPDKIRRPAPKIVHQEASPNLSSSRPAPVPRAEKRQRGNDRADLTLPARWWNIPFALASVVACAVLVGGLGVETIRVHRSQAILAKTLANPQATPDAIVAAARSMESSPLARWDAYREHLLAQATLLACERSPGLASADRQTQRDNARHLFKRAAERSPGSPYHQLNRALLASETDANERWNRIEQIPRPDGVIQEQIALRQIRVGQTAKGIDQLRSLLAKEPASAGRIVQSLLAAGVGTAVAMEMVPDAPPAWLDLAMLLKREAVIGLRREIEERLDQVDARSASDPSIVTSAVKAAEWGEVEIQLERWDRAARWAERAIEQDPTNPRWKLILADTLAHQDRFEEANRLLAELPVKLAPTESAQRQALLQRMTGNRSEAIPVSAAQAN